MMFLNAFVARFGEQRLLIAIAVISFVIQVVAMRSPVIFGEPYVVAKNLVAGKGFVFTYPMTSNLTVTSYVTPLYVFLQIPFLMSGLGERGIQVFNLILLQAACYVLFRFFRRFISAPIALLSYLALSFYIPFWILGYALEPNTLNLLLIVLTIDCLYLLSKRSSAGNRVSAGRWIQLGLLIGIQILVRPDILIGAACFAVWLLFTNRSNLRSTIRGILGAAAIACLIVAPWTLRNYLTFHRFILVSANSGFNLYVGNNPTATGEISQFPASGPGIELERRIESFGIDHDPVEVDALRKSLSIDWIVAHPVETFELDLKKVYYHWFGRNDFGTQYHYYQHSLTDIYLILSVLLISLGAIGLWRINDRRVQSLLLTLFVYSTLVSAIFFVQSRHRALKVDPFLVPLSVIGLCHLAFRGTGQLHSSSLAVPVNEY